MSGGISVSADTSDINRMSKKFQDMQKRAPNAAVSVSRKMGTEYQKKVKAHASGRPGPNVITGSYRDSINIVGTEGPTTYVGSAAPQARRLEMGYVGTDSLGRHYSQAPLPHYRPALVEMQSRSAFYGEMLAKAVLFGVVTAGVGYLAAELL